MFWMILRWEMHCLFCSGWFHAARRMLVTIYLLAFVLHVWDMLQRARWPGGFFVPVHYVVGLAIYGIAPYAVVAMGVITPLVSAMAFGDDKNKRMLDLLRSTHARPMGLVLAKWTAALAQIGLLVGGFLPLYFFLAGLLEWSLVRCLCPLAALGAVALAFSAIGTLASVLLPRTTQALLASGLGAVAWCGCLYPLFVDTLFNPFLPRLPELWARLFLANGLACLLFLGLAAWRIKRGENFALPRWLAALGRTFQRRTRMPDESEPVRWKEREFAAPWRLGVATGRWFGVLCILAASLTWVAYAKHATGAAVAFSIVMFLFFAVQGALRGCAAIAVERDQHTWDWLRTLPMDMDSLVAQKLAGVQDAMRPYYCVMPIPLFAWACEQPMSIPVAVISWLIAWQSYTVFAAYGLESAAQGHGMLASFWLAMVRGIVTVAIRVAPLGAPLLVFAVENLTHWHWVPWFRWFVTGIAFVVGASGAWLIYVARTRRPSLERIRLGLQRGLG